MYQNYSTVTNTELLPWVEKLSGFSLEQIKALIDKPALNVPDEARGILEKHQWATAARAICMRAPGDDPETWRNALPPDRVPIVLTFNQECSNPQGYAPSAAPAIEHDHFPNYKYIGVDEEGRHMFINSVLRVKRDKSEKDEKDTVGSELIVLLGEGKFVSLYLGNDGDNLELPKEFREVRLNKDLPTTYKEVLADITKEMEALPENAADARAKLNTHLLNYQGYLAALPQPA